MANLATDTNLVVTVAGIIALGLAPLAFLLWFFYTRDKLDPEPHGLIFRVFLLGALAFVPGFLLRQFLPLPYWLVGLLILPVVNELAKFCVVRFGIFNHPEFDEPLDGIIFAATAGLGFASVDVVISMVHAYLQMAQLGIPAGQTSGATLTAVLEMFALKGLLTGPGQALWSSLWGYALGLAKFAPVRQRDGLIRNGLLAAMLSHAAFNGLAMEPDWWLNRVGLVLVVGVLLFVVMRCIRYAESLSPFARDGY
jgi:RsiW-degrading membrane proteinase PrsW (M82 family)